MFIYIILYILSSLFVISFINLNNKGFIYLLMYMFNFIDYNFLILSIFLITISNIFYIKYFLILIIFTPQNYILNFSLFKTSWVSGLLYGFNLIHPILFYLTVLSLFYFLFYSFKFFKIIISNLIYIGFLSLLLGMFWGSINEGWGFFWTNDLIELILLFYIICLIIILHSIKTNFYKISIFFFCITIILIFVRFNIVFSVHSFFVSSKIKSLYLWYYFWVQFNYYRLFIYLYTYFFFYIFISYICLTYIFNFKNIHTNYLYLYYFHVLIFLVFFNFMFNITYYVIIDYILVNIKLYSNLYKDSLITNSKYLLNFNNFNNILNKTLNYIFIYYRLANLYYNYLYLLYLIWLYFIIFIFTISILKIYNN